MYWAVEQPRQKTILLFLHDEHNEQTKEGPFSFVLFESPPQFQQSAGATPLRSLWIGQGGILEGDRIRGNRTWLLEKKDKGGLGEEE